MNEKVLAVQYAAQAPAFTAADTQREADFTVEVTKDGEGVIIKKYTGALAVVRIPSTIQGLPVRKIGDRAFYDNYTVTSVVIPAGVTKIGAGAFSCNERAKSKMQLTSVTIPEGVTEIDNEAFQDCPLAAVTLPQSLTTLGHSAFKDTNITAVTLPAALTNFGFQDKNNMAFTDCKKLKTVTLPEGMKTIPIYMFWDCPALTTVTVPEGLETISRGAFLQCTALTSITLPSSIRTIGKQAFEGCTNLMTVTIPDSVKTIRFTNNGEFAGCAKLSNASRTALKNRGYMSRF